MKITSVHHLFTSKAKVTVSIEQTTAENNSSVADQAAVNVKTFELEHPANGFEQHLAKLVAWNFFASLTQDL